MRYIFSFTFFLIFTFSFSQVKDTIYYSKYWSKTTKSNAEYFRPFPFQKENNLYVVKDYYKGGKLQMKGYSLSNEKDIWEGKVEWYYPNGQVQLIQHYKNGKLYGNQKSFFRDGKLLSDAQFENGYRQTGTYYTSVTELDKTTTYKDGKSERVNAYYEDTKTIARKTYYYNSNGKDRLVFFDKKGQQISHKNPKEQLREGLLKITKNKNVEAIYAFKYRIKENDSTYELVRDVDGNILAKGALSNETSYQGSFFRDGKLLRYKKGTLHGEALHYNNQYQIIAKGYYDSGVKYSGEFYNQYSDEIEIFKEGEIVEKISKNKFTGQTYRCTFENDYKPITGEYYAYEVLKTYKDGIQTKQINYHYDTGAVKDVSFFEDDGILISKKIFHRDNKTYTLNYNDGIPYEGIELITGGYVTYKEGATNGSFLIEDNKHYVTGNYIQNFKEEGEILYVIKKTKDTLACTFENGKPITGTTYGLGNTITYKDGKKEGCAYKTYNNIDFEYDSLKICYKNDKPIGTATYYLKNNLVANAKYKNAKLYDGSFYNLFNKLVYDNGKLKERVIANGRYFVKQQLFEDAKLAKEIVKYKIKDSITSTLIYKNEKPFEGTQVSYDSISRLYTIRNFTKGKKEGFQTTYSYFSDPFISKISYKNGKKEGEGFYNTKFSDTTFKIIFKKNKPIEGVVIDNAKNHIRKITYRDGEIKQIAYFEKYSSKQIASITYKNGNPFKGHLLYDKEKDRIVEVYEDGQLTKTLIGILGYPLKGTLKARFEVHHLSLKDSIVVDRYLNPKIIITYKNKHKKSGKINFFRNDTIAGQASFDANKINVLNYRKTNKDTSVETVVLKDSELIYTISLEEFKGQYKVENKTLKTPVYFGVLSLLKDQPKDVVIELYMNNNLMGTMEMKDGRRYEGIILYPEYRSELYRVSEYAKGKRIYDFRDLSKSEAVAKFKELQALKE